MRPRVDLARTILATAILATATLVVAPTARANDLAALFEPDTVLSVGGFVGAGPRFQGANRIGAWGLPYATFRKAEEARAWFSPDDGLDAALVGEGAASLGAVLDFREGRSPRDDRRLAGLPRLPATAGLGLGLYAEVWPVADTLRLRAEVTQGLRAHDGIVAKFAADLVGRFGRFTVSGGPRFVVGDTAALRLDFDVPVARASAFEPYRAHGGPRSLGATAAVAYEWSEAWQTLAYARYDRLVGAAAASPIVRRIGTVTGLTLGVGAIYSFRPDS